LIFIFVFAVYLFVVVFIAEGDTGVAKMVFEVVLEAEAAS
jgi:hypothetical protein